jgi:hypothetical protein
VPLALDVAGLGAVRTHVRVPFSFVVRWTAAHRRGATTSDERFL